MIIDSHHHFWQYSATEYAWIGDEMSTIRRSFLPPQLEAEIDRAGVDAVISVQARQCVEETDWLLELAAEHDFIHGVVGWVPLRDDAIESILERYRENPFLCGIRHVVQDEKDDEFILGERFNRGVSYVGKAGLAYDILIFERHLPAAIAFADRHEDMRLVLDHIAKPRIRDRQWQPWADGIRDLARREHVTCKLSGLVTEADPTCWSAEQLRPYVETVLDAFGPERIMFGSDWPVSLLACTYKRWFDLVCDSISDLSESEQADILGGTAQRAYQVPCGTE